MVTFFYQSGILFCGNTFHKFYFFTRNGGNVSMDEKIMKFFNRNNIEIRDIKYLAREQSKTCIYLIDGRVVRTYIPTKDFYAVLASSNFLNINKGVVVSRSQIDHIANSCYYMIDGAVFEGRKRTAAAHKALNKELHQYQVDTPTPDMIRERFSVLDNMPEAFCVLEIVFSRDGSGMDFVFRYCNQQMANLEHRTLEEMLDHSFSEVIHDSAQRWLVAYADVATTGNCRFLRDYSPDIDKELYITCFQPAEGFCACLITPVKGFEQKFMSPAEFLGEVSQEYRF